MLREKGTVFFPDKLILETPADWLMPYQDVFFHASDGVKLHGWFIPAKEGKANLLWFHGNAGNISHRLENIYLLHHKVGINIFIFDYREYGRSEGEISKAGTFLDAHAAYDCACSHLGLDPNMTILFGRSLGTALVVELAVQKPCLGVILESAFTSTDDMMRLYFPFLPPPEPGAVKYDSLSKIGSLKTSKLIIHGEYDEIIPIWMGRGLFDAASEPKEFYLIKGAHHNDTYIVGGEEYFQTIANFIQQLTEHN